VTWLNKLTFKLRCRWLSLHETPQ